MLKFYIIILCFASAFYIPSAGGTGVNLGYNLLLLLFVGLAFIFLSCRRQPLCRVANNQWLVISGALCTGIPWAFQTANSSGVIIFCVAFVCWSLMRPWYLNDNTKRQIVALIFCLSLVQCGIALIQTFSPALGFSWYEYSWLRNHGRPYGIFQQVNLLGSFLATGSGCGFLLLQKETRFLRSVVCFAGLALLAFVIALVQSRAGMVGAVIVVLAQLPLFQKNQTSKILVALGLMILATVAGYWIVLHTHVVINGKVEMMAREFQGSNHERLHILATTLTMIAQKPFSGWGYGTFEYAFSRFVMAHPDPGYQYTHVITHPHNELLFFWFQGGILGLIGVGLLFSSWINNVLCAIHKKNQSAGYSLLLLPLLVHMNLEYPLYQSFIHLAVFVLLLRIGEQDELRTAVQPVYVLNTGMLVIGACLFCYSVIALFAHQQLTQLERNNYVDFPKPMPWYFYMQPERAQYDEMVSQLVDYNNSHNPDDLVEFMTAARKYSLKHNDRNVLLSMIAIERFYGHQQQSQALLLQYQQLFPTVP
ncbi:hypothetical protein CJP72_21130 [Citrobacter sp. NCU1]|uniref:PglL family O-oligosaccharyltransferase n=1 Tax=Citrobacter sp. NCU1 TaxID=2026683 RepID=UPI00139142D9|nr:O-antigen ligase family protein [Citrobacter sp. NCU1]NDO83181.1 hypothetical protein [Citrobacter sp. NCU1]